MGRSMNVRVKKWHDVKPEKDSEIIIRRNYHHIGFLIWSGKLDNVDAFLLDDNHIYDKVNMVTICVPDDSEWIYTSQLGW